MTAEEDLYIATTAIKAESLRRIDYKSKSMSNIINEQSEGSAARHSAVNIAAVNSLHGPVPSERGRTARVIRGGSGNENHDNTADTAPLIYG